MRLSLIQLRSTPCLREIICSLLNCTRTRVAWKKFSYSSQRQLRLLVHARGWRRWVVVLLRGSRALYGVKRDLGMERGVFYECDTPNPCWRTTHRICDPGTTRLSICLTASNRYGT